MSELGYFEHPFCSNSKLSNLGRELGLLTEIKGNSYEAFRWGTLLDAVVTEPEIIDLFQMKILGTDYSFTKEEYETCNIMKKRLEQDPVYKTFLSCNPSFQKEIYIEDFDFGAFKMNMKAKLDFYVPGLVVDLKSTATTSQKAFEQSVRLFGYDRQMVLYCLMTKAKRATLFGVSKKKPHNVFKVIIQEGDARWKKGYEELMLLATKYYLTK